MWSQESRGRSCPSWALRSYRGREARTLGLRAIGSSVKRSFRETRARDRGSFICFRERLCRAVFVKIL